MRKGIAMNVFQAAKQVSAADAARKLGLKENHGRFLCPFHDDHQPSMACYKDTGRFYCFTCHAKGDATDLWARVTGRAPKAAAQELCAAFGLHHTPQSSADIARKKRMDDVALLPQAVYQDWQRRMIDVLEMEVEACTALMQRWPDPEGWLWSYALDRAARLQDELSAIRAIDPKDLKDEVAMRRAAPARSSDRPALDDALLRAILDDLLRRTQVRLDQQEQATVCRMLSIPVSAR